MFLTSFFIQGSIIFGVIVLFIVTYTLNKKIKVKKDDSLPEKCQGCTSNSCMINIKTIEEITEEMKKYVKEKCDEDEK